MEELATQDASRMFGGCTYHISCIWLVPCAHDTVSHGPHQQQSHAQAQQSLIRKPTDASLVLLPNNSHISGRIQSTWDCMQDTGTAG